MNTFHRDNYGHKEKGKNVYEGFEKNHSQMLQLL